MRARCCGGSRYRGGGRNSERGVTLRGRGAAAEQRAESSRRSGRAVGRPVRSGVRARRRVGRDDSRPCTSPGRGGRPYCRRRRTSITATEAPHEVGCRDDRECSEYEFAEDPVPKPKDAQESDSDVAVTLRIYPGVPPNEAKDEPQRLDSEHQPGEEYHPRPPFRATAAAGASQIRQGPRPERPTRSAPWAQPNDRRSPVWIVRINRSESDEHEIGRRSQKDRSHFARRAWAIMRVTTHAHQRLNPAASWLAETAFRGGGVGGKRSR